MKAGLFADDSLFSSILCRPEYVIMVRRLLHDADLYLAHQVLLRGHDSVIRHTPRNTELALYGNGISSGQNIYKWQANANHGLPMIAETLHQNFMQHR